jgi:nucleoside-diphosphate kinase
MEQTYLMIKPEIGAARLQKIGAILNMVNEAGFRILEVATLELNRETAERFYAEHRGKAFFEDLVTYITSGPVLAVRLERENGVAHLRRLIGATDPAQAEPGTIRFLYGKSLQENAVHASASLADSQRELAIIFGKQQRSP